MTSWFFCRGQQGKPKKGKDEQTPRHLGDGDAGFTHLADAGFDNGIFAVREARERPEQADRGASRITALPIGNYNLPPQLAKGLKSCDLSHASKDADGKQAIDLEIAIFTDPDNASTMRPLIQAWNSNEQTQMIHDCEMVWMEARQGANDCMLIGTSFDYANGEKKKDITFPRPLKGGMEVEICYWIQDFRFGTESKEDFACDFWASNVTQEGFTANASGSTNAERLVITWIVYKKGKRRVASGQFSVDDDDSRQEDAAQNSGRVTFAEGAFEKAPTVLVGLSQFEMAGGRDLRLGVDVQDVDESGFTWHINTWGDNSEDALHSAEATYIALGFV